MGVSTAAPTLAQPTCDGKVATITDNGPGDNDPAVGIIVGTNGRDIIVGTDGMDVIEGLGGKDIICGRGDFDLIDGGNKRDRIFGGSGPDTLIGGRGADDLFGWTGADLIRGGLGNDFINGGPDADDCRQGPGRGGVKDCERADLKVKVIAPSSPADADGATFKVRVKNRGPDATTYSMTVGEENSGASCNADWEDEERQYAKLRPGKSRTRAFTTVCDDLGGTPMVRVTAFVETHAKDKNLTNNSAKSRFVDLE